MCVSLCAVMAHYYKKKCTKNYTINWEILHCMSQYNKINSFSRGFSCGLSPSTLMVVITHEWLPLLDVFHHHVHHETEGGRSCIVKEKKILSPECVGAISHKGMLLCACHLNDKWSYCGQHCTVYVAFIENS